VCGWQGQFCLLRCILVLAFQTSLVIGYGAAEELEMMAIVKGLRPAALRALGSLACSLVSGTPSCTC
jgi:hypothetical protein